SAGLKFIRLSAASKHLGQHTLLELFANFHSNGVERAVQLDERTLILDAPPSLGDLLLKTIKRKKIYRWAKFSYCIEEDKILGIRLESSRPLDRQQVSFIEKNYGFIQKKTADSRDDQRAGTGLHTGA
ncbi:MAG: hypothetical protein V2I35_07425, partial [Desulfocapsaceae bacterium]|nr:hypothetical protein [Desulfocapsaceae bacterium]